MHPDAQSTVYPKGHIMCQAVLKCYTCDRVFENKDRFWKHKYYYRQSMVKCAVCGASMKERSLAMHYKMLHETTGEMFRCDQCGREYKTRTGLKVHERYHSKKAEEKSVEYTIKCDQCDKVYTNQSAFRAHMKASHPITPPKPKICETCGKIYHDKFSFRKHVLTHAQDYKKLKCDECDKTFFTRGGLLIHKRIHLNLRRMCEVCGKSFIHGRSLTIHLRTHTGEKPFKCATCGKSFIARNRLMEHERVHTKERPFKCKKCKKRFTQHHTLKEHMSNHTGTKPFQCIVCQKKFGTKGLLNAHIKYAHERTD